MVELEKILVAKATEADSKNTRPPEDAIEHACLNASKEQKLMCLRGRKYSPERAAKLLPQMLQLMKDYDINNTAEGADTERLKLDVATHKVVPVNWQLDLPLHDSVHWDRQSMRSLTSITCDSKFVYVSDYVMCYGHESHQT